MGEFVTAEAARQRFMALLDAVDAAHAEMRALSTDDVSSRFRAQVAERLETQHRTNRGLMYRMVSELADPPDEAAPMPDLVKRLAARLRISDVEIKRRIKVAETIRPRRQITGPPLPPLLPAAAEAVESGAIGDDHLAVITETMKKLASSISADERADIEATLARAAGKHDAAFVKDLGTHLDDLFNPDGHFDESDRARRRGLALGPQQPDGMSKLSPPLSARADTCPMARSKKLPTTAACLSGATTASNSASRPA